MIAIQKEPAVESCSSYCIRLNISPAEREDAWELCGVIQRLGGIEIRDRCFAFANEQRRWSALDMLRRQFGPRYFEAIGPGTRDHERENQDGGS